MIKLINEKPLPSATGLMRKQSSSRQGEITQPLGKGTKPQVRSVVKEEG